MPFTRGWWDYFDLRCLGGFVDELKVGLINKTLVDFRAASRYMLDLGPGAFAKLLACSPERDKCAPPLFNRTRALFWSAFAAKAAKDLARGTNTDEARDALAKSCLEAARELGWGPSCRRPTDARNESVVFSSTSAKALVEETFNRLNNSSPQAAAIASARHLTLGWLADSPPETVRVPVSLYFDQPVGGLRAFNVNLCFQLIKDAPPGLLLLGPGSFFRSFDDVWIRTLRIAHKLAGSPAACWWVEVRDASINREGLSEKAQDEVSFGPLGGSSAGLAAYVGFQLLSEGLTTQCNALFSAEIDENGNLRTVGGEREKVEATYLDYNKNRSLKLYFAGDFENRSVQQDLEIGRVCDREEAMRLARGPGKLFRQGTANAATTDHKFFTHPVFDDAKKWLLSPQQKPLLWLHGMGGVGKSTMARMLADAADVRMEFTDGILWFDGPGELKEGLGSLVRDALRKDVRLPASESSLRTEPDAWNAVVEILRASRRKLRLFWIIDNVGDDHVQRTRLREMVLNLAQEGHLVRFLVTSRQTAPKGFIKDRVSDLDVSCLNEMQGLDYLKCAARDLQQDAEIPEVKAKEVVNRCGGLPLALDICAAQIAKEPDWENLLRRLGDARRAMRLLRYGERDFSEVLVMAVRSISEKEDRECFKSLAAFGEGAIPQKALESFWGREFPRVHLGDTLEILAKSHLLQWDRENHRVILHDLVRTYLEYLDENKDWPQALLEHYRDMTNGQWHTGPNDGYFFQNIAKHLGALKDADELFYLARSDEFLDAQYRNSPEDPLLPKRTILLALERAGEISDRRAQAEFAQSSDNLWRRWILRDPLSALKIKKDSAQEALSKAMMLVEFVPLASRAQVLLAMAYYLKQEGRTIEAQEPLLKFVEFCGGVPDPNRDISAVVDQLKPTGRPGREFDADAWAAALGIQLVSGINATDYGFNSIVDEYVLQWQFSKAIETAEMIKNPADRNAALVRVVETQVAGGLFDDASITADKIGNDVRRATALALIVEARDKPVLDTVDAQIAAGLFGDASVTALNITHYDRRANAFVRIVDAQIAQKKFGDASDTAAKIEDDNRRVDAFARILEAQAAKGLFGDALDTAAKIEDDNRRVGAFARILEAQAAKGLFEDALVTAAKIEDDYRRDDALARIVEAQVAKDLFDDALVTAANIQYYYTRDDAFARIVEAQVAKELFKEASVTAANIQYYYRRDDAFARIVEARDKPVLDTVDAQIAAGLFGDASVTALNITHYDRRANAFVRIVDAQIAQKKFEDASDTAAKIEDDNRRVDAFARIVEAQVTKELFEEASVTAAKIKGDDRRDGAFARIVEAQVTKELFEEASVTAAKIKGDDRRDGAFAHIVEAQVAKELFGDASITTLNIKADDRRANAFVRIVEAQVGAGLFKEASVTAANIQYYYRRVGAFARILEAQVAKELFEEASVTAEMIEDDDRRDDAFARIVEAQFAKELSEEALVTAAKIKHRNRRDDAIVDAQIAKGLFEDALVTAAKIEDDYRRDRAFARIVEAHDKPVLEIVDTQIAAELFEEASVTAAKIKDYYRRDRAFARIVEAQVTKELFEEASVTAAKIKGDDRRDDTLARIVEAQVAKELFEEASVTAAKIKDDDRHDDTLARIVEAQVAKELFEEASVTAAKIKDDDRHDDALARIVEAQIDARLFEDALATAAKIKGDDHRYDAIVDAQIAAGRFEDALATAAKIKGDDRRYDAILDAQIAAGRFEDASVTAARIGNQSHRDSALVRLVDALMDQDLFEFAREIAVRIEMSHLRERTRDLLILREMKAQISMGRWAEAGATEKRFDWKQLDYSGCANLSVNIAEALVDAFSKAGFEDKAQDLRRMVSDKSLPPQHLIREIRWLLNSMP